MSNLFHIVEGWSKSIGLMKVDEATMAMAKERIEICKGCDQLESYSAIKLANKKVNNIEGVRCKICTCPINEKVLVTNEKCPLEKWKTII